MDFPRITSNSAHSRVRRGRAGVVFALLGALAMAVACGEDDRASVTMPTPINDPLSGTWSGTLTEAAAGTGRLEVLLEVRPALGGTTRVVTGTWNVRFDNPSRSDQGTIAGSLTGDQLALELRPAARPTCPTSPGPVAPVGAGTWSLLMTASPQVMSGSSLYFTCSSSSPGQVQLSR